MKANAYDPTNDILSLKSNGATDEQIRLIVDVRRRMTRLGAAREKLRREERAAQGREDCPKQAKACPFLNLVDSLRASVREV